MGLEVEGSIPSRNFSLANLGATTPVLTLFFGFFFFGMFMLLYYYAQCSPIGWRPAPPTPLLCGRAPIDIYETNPGRAHEIGLVLLTGALMPKEARWAAGVGREVYGLSVVTILN